VISEFSEIWIATFLPFLRKTDELSSSESWGVILHPVTNGFWLISQICLFRIKYQSDFRFGLMFRYHSSIFFYLSMPPLIHMFLTGRKIKNFSRDKLIYSHGNTISMMGGECSLYLKLKICFFKICNLGTYYLCDMMRHVRRITCHYLLFQHVTLASIMEKNGNTMKQCI
jgi:hypothetical protein